MGSGKLMELLLNKRQNHILPPVSDKRIQDVHSVVGQWITKSLVFGVDVVY